MINHGDPSQVQLMVAYSAIETLCSLLKLADRDLLIEALGAIYRILEVEQNLTGSFEHPLVEVDKCGGIAIIEALQKHESIEVYDKCIQIIDTFIGAVDEEDENIAPLKEGDTFSLGVPSNKLSGAPTKDFNFNISSPFK